MISEDDRLKLLEEFLQPREEFSGKNYATRRRGWFDKPMEEIKPFLSKDRLKLLSKEEAMKIYTDMSVGGPKLYPNTYIENGLDRIRKALLYLLYGEDELAIRFFNFASNPESQYRINGVGRAFASTALLLLDSNNFAIWNSAIDGGLKKLEILPDKMPRSNLGEQYVEILKTLKELQSRCDFKDLSVTDEFVELIFHEKIGGDLFQDAGKEIEAAVEVEEVGAEDEQIEHSHLRIQYLLVMIGNMRNYDVWVANNDRNKTYKGECLADLSIDTLPIFGGPHILRVAKAIDVIWFKERSAQPIGFYEIEHTTSMYSGLLRLNDVKTDYPIQEAHIVAPIERLKMFENQIQRRTFAHSELSEVCKFMSYKQVEELYGSYVSIKTILP